MQPNLSLDPAANLWSSNPPGNNLFAQAGSPEAGNNNSAFDMNSNFYPTQNIGNVMDMGKQDGSMLTASTSNDNASNNGGGQVFMGGEETPGGVPNWKWTAMSDKK